MSDAPTEPLAAPTQPVSPAAELREIAHWLPLFANIQYGITRMNGGKFDPARAFKFLAGEWAKVEGCFRRVDDIPPDMPTETPTEAHLRNEVNRLLRVCLDAVARWEPAGRGKRKRTPETPRKQTLYVTLRSLREGRGMTVSRVVEYLATSDGRDLNELVQEELRRHPQKRGRGGKPAKKRTARDVINAAFKATYPSGRPTRG